MTMSLGPSMQNKITFRTLQTFTTLRMVSKKQLFKLLLNEVSNHLPKKAQFWAPLSP